LLSGRLDEGKKQAQKELKAVNKRDMQVTDKDKYGQVNRIYI
jgi:hypothetical protein